MPEPYPFPSASSDNKYQPPETPTPSQQPPVQSPPPPPITIRTMESDTKSMQSSGGTPIPQQVKLDELKLPEPENESIFSNAVPPAYITSEKKGVHAWAKTTGLILGVLVLVGGFGFLGYYVVYPLIFPPQIELPVIQEPPITATPPITAPEVPVLIHQSFFTLPANQSETLNVTAITVENIKEALAVSAAQILATGSVKEVVFETAAGQIKASEFLPTMLNVFTNEEIGANFEDGFTSYLYYDPNGVWPGFIFKLKPTAMLFEAQSVAQKLETAPVTTFKNIYLVEPRNPTSENFLNGQFKGTATRYLPFQLAGATLNYGILDRYLLISTSYGGFLDAANRLGL